MALYIQMQLCTWTLADWLRERNAGSAEGTYRYIHFMVFNHILQSMKICIQRNNMQTTKKTNIRTRHIEIMNKYHT